jgi:hypothetical protein
VKRLCKDQQVTPGKWKFDCLLAEEYFYFARGGVISRAQIAIGRMYIPARKFPVISQASGVRNQ